MSAATYDFVLTFSFLTYNSTRLKADDTVRLAVGVLMQTIASVPGGAPVIQS